MFKPISAVPLPRRTELLLRLWERLLKEAAEALLAELRLVSAEERDGVAGLWESLHDCVGDVEAELCGALDELRAEAEAS